MHHSVRFIIKYTLLELLLSVKLRDLQTIQCNILFAAETKGFRNLGHSRGIRFIFSAVEGTGKVSSNLFLWSFFI